MRAAKELKEQVLINNTHSNTLLNVEQSLANENICLNLVQVTKEHK